VSSDGSINVYDLSLLPPSTPTERTVIAEIAPVVTYDSKGSRLICVTLAGCELDYPEETAPEKGAKRKREMVSEGEEEEEEWLGLSESDGVT
jgi:protein MAK11